MQNYEINSDTLAIIPISNYKSKIIEKNSELEVDMTPMKIIDNSCRYFGSSYKGRFFGTRSLIGVSHKAPIIVEESRELIFFPTSSPRQYECAWISLKNINDYKRTPDASIIIFNTGYNLELDMSYGSLDNQILRAARLESVLRKRKVA
ncbi:MAG: competence protein ComK [Bacilli bacterium]|jgi:competence protein ComK|nr:competence protein ComK [Bacilli bacterium]